MVCFIKGRKWGGNNLARGVHGAHSDQLNSVVSNQLTLDSK